MFYSIKNQTSKAFGSTKLINNVALCCIIVLLLFSCGSKTRKNDKAVAKVGDKYLYFSEMSHIFGKGVSKEDSAAHAKLFIDNWIKTRLLLKKAELNLSAEQLDISKEIETYRTSLLIYKYEDLWLQEKMDTTVLESEIRQYYEANQANFSLEEYAVRAVYIQLPINAPTVWNVRRWYVSDRERDVQDLADYCQNHAVKYDLIDDEWVQWANIERELPQQEAAKRQMTQYSYFEQQDGDFLYFVRIRERRAPGDTAPLVFVKDKVKSIIINKRKLKLISDLERSIYDDALLKNQFEIYHNIN